jgi:hypothetical protein
MKRYNPADILLPWVELELLDLDPKFNFDATTDITLSPFVEVRSWALDNYADFIAAISSLYKRMKPVFRTVANAICTYELDLGKYPFPVAKHLRPFEQDKMRICNAIARFLDNYRRTGGSDFGIFKSPLKLLVEMSYGLNNTFAADEIAILFDLLVEAMGIRTQFVLSQSPTGQRKLDVACQTKTIETIDPQRNEDANIENYTFYSFNSQKYIFSRSFNYIGNYKTFDTLNVEIDPYSLNIKEVVIRQLVSKCVGTGNRNLTRTWNNGMLTNEASRSNWFPLLEKARSNFEVNDYPYIASIFSRQKGVTIGHNYGPQATASIMAWTANSMTVYKDVFIAFLKEVVMQPNIAYEKPDLSDFMGAMNGCAKSMKKVLSRLFYTIRQAFPYCEETIGVEQIASPLKMMLIHAFHPYIQRYDCDDLTLVFMAFVEALGAEKVVRDTLGLKSMVRLAGNPGEYEIKYHVYPVIKFDRVDRDEYVHDVSAPTDELYWQMNHGGNKEDYIPTVQSSYIPYIRQLSSGAAGYTSGRKYRDSKIIRL